MKLKPLSLALLLGLGLPGSAQASIGSWQFSPPYSVSVISPAHSPFNFVDVVNVHGLQTTKLLATALDSLPTRQQSVPGKVLFSFMREWTGEMALANLVGAPSPPADLKNNHFATIRLNPPAPLPDGSPSPLPSPLPEHLVLSNPNFVEWELFIENGVVVTEDAAFLYSAKQIVGESAAK